MRPAVLAMYPSAVFRRVRGALMERINARAYWSALDILSPGIDEHVLEIGFGTGKFTELLLESCRTVHVAGIDPAATMVEVASSRRVVRAAGARADLRQGNASALPWPDGYFHAVVAIHSFQFWSDPRESLCEVSRVLSKTGRLILVLRNHRRHKAEWLPNPLTRSLDEVPETISLLEQRGFLVQQFSDVGSSHVVLAELCSNVVYAS